MTDRRIIIILLASVVFVASTISIGTFLGVPVSQAETILTLVGLALTFTISAEQIIRWTETAQPEDRKMTESASETGRTHSNPEESTFKDESKPTTTDSLYSSFKDDNGWKEYHDRGYESERVLSKFANQTGEFLYQLPGITPPRVWAAIAFTMFLGLAGSTISISEFFAQLGTTHQFLQSISSTFSIHIIESNPMLSMVFSLFISVLPFVYLVNKQNMSCSACGADFSLQSLGRFYDQKEKVPITDEEGNVENHYYEYDGYRLVECEECGNQFKERKEWSDR